MDPNETLSEILALASAIVEGDGSDDEVSDLAGAILDLDEWICNEGFLPARWAGDK